MTRAAEPGLEAELRPTVVSLEFTREFRRHLCAGKQCFWTATNDALSCYHNIVHSADEIGGYQVVQWDSVNGWTAGTVDPTPEVGKVAEKLGCREFDPQIKLDPVNVLRAVLVFESFRHAVIVLWNFEEFFQARNVREQLIQLEKSNSLGSSATARPIFFLCSSDVAEAHPKVTTLFKHLDFGLPTREEIRNGPVDFIVNSLAQDQPDEERPAPQLLDDIAKACSGLGRTDVLDVLAYSVAVNKGIRSEALTEIRREKAKLLSRSRVLSPLSDSELDDPSNVGGMDQLIDDISLAALAYTDDAQRHQLDLPRGIIVMGLPGTGKSMVSKATGRIFREVCGNEFPVVRIDVGAMFNKHLGESEKSFREMKRILKTAGPCVGFMDEVQRSLEGMSAGGNLDSGVGQRLYGDFMSWTNDRFKQGDQTYMVYTMNSPKRLAANSPEFFRRVDAVYFADLPDHNVRRQIFKIHLGLQLAKDGLALEALEWDDEDFDALAEATKDFVGDEIAKAIIKARAVSFRAGRRPPIVQFDDLMGPSAIGGMKEHIIAVTQKKELEELRDFCKDARPVARPAPAPKKAKAATTQPGGRRILRGASDN